MRKVIQTCLVVAAVILIAYWSIWFVDRTVLASETTQAYYDFENAFPLADGWLLLTCVAGFVTLTRRRPAALFWLLCAGSAGLYLFGMDLLYDLEHGIFDNGSAGLTELAIVTITFAFSVLVLWWAWSRRDELLAGPRG
jgi:hypothetical protein